MYACISTNSATLLLFLLQNHASNERLVLLLVQFGRELWFLSIFSFLADVASSHVTAMIEMQFPQFPEAGKAFAHYFADFIQFTSAARHFMVLGLASATVKTRWSWYLDLVLK